MGSKRKNKEAKRKQKQQRRAERALPQSGPHDPFEPLEPFEGGAGVAFERQLELQAGARLALGRDPDDVPALLLLARELSHGPAEQLALLRRAVASAERGLRAARGEDVFERSSGALVLDAETANYFLAREGLIDALLAEGRAQEALAESHAFMEVCASDVLQTRLRYVAAAFELGQLEDLDAYCRDDPQDEFGPTIWNAALLAFARSGPQDERACALLSAACRRAPSVVTFLLSWGGMARLGASDEPEVGEADFYVSVSRRAWASVPGALAWLYAQSETTGAQLPARLFPTKLRTRVRSLPQVDELWRLEQRLLPETIEIRGQPVWASALLSAPVDHVLDSDVATREPRARELWAFCLQAMHSPQVGKPRRPQVVELRSDHYPELVAACLEAGIEVRQAPWLRPELDRFYAGMISAMGGNSSLPAWTSAPGVTDGHIVSLCAAAAAFYQHTPWQVTTGARGYLVAAAEPGCAVLGAAVPCAIVLGADGETFGVTLYESLEAAKQAREWTPSGAPPSKACALNFDPAELLAPQDRARIEALGCEVPGAEAYPLAYRLDPSERRALCPELAQLRQLEVLLRLFPAALSAKERPGEVYPLELHDGTQVRVRVEEVSLRRE